MSASSRISNRISDSFNRLKEVLGFGDTEKERSFKLSGKELKELRERVKDNVVITSKYSWYSFLPVNLFQ